MQDSERQPIQSQQNQEDPRSTEYLIVFEVLNFIENVLFELLNKVDDSAYCCDVVNLSKYVLNDHE